MALVNGLTKQPKRVKKARRRRTEQRISRISLKATGVLLIVVGLLISVGVAAAGAISDARLTAALAEQGGAQDLSRSGFDPMIVPRAGFIEPPNAPLLFPQTSGLIEKSKIPSTTYSGSSSPLNTRQNSAASKEPESTATPPPIWIPNRIVIPAIRLDAPVELAKHHEIEVQGLPYQQWDAPDSFSVGRLLSSAPLGSAGNTVFLGHHNIYGEVFGHLVDLKVGDLILAYSGNKEFAYEISQKMILLERDQPPEVRLKNADWIAPTQDERLTLVTCWPFNNNTHRLVIVARPVSLSAIKEYEMIARITPQPH